MPTGNLFSIVYTPQEVADINTHVTALRDIFVSKLINLTADERNQYGRLGDGTENFVVKVMDYANQRPEIIPGFVDQAELAKDIAARNILTPLRKSFNMLSEGVDDTHRLLGFDIYWIALAIYNNVKLMARQNVPGINVIYDDLKKQFPGRPKIKPPTDSNPNDSNPDNNTPNT